MLVSFSNSQKNSLAAVLSLKYLLFILALFVYCDFRMSLFSCFREMYRSPQGGIFTRRNFYLCKVIIATSLVWFMVDVFLLMYFTDCSSSVIGKEDCLEKQLHSNSSVVLGDGLEKESRYVNEDKKVATAENQVHAGCKF